MTEKMDVVKAWTDGPVDIGKSVDLVSDDFEFLDQEGNVTMDKQAYLGFGQLLQAALPDLEYERTELRQEGDYVVISGRWKGTFTNEFDLSAMGMGTIPASGKKVEWPETSSKIEVEGGKIARIHPYGDSGGGMEAFLAQLRS